MARNRNSKLTTLKGNSMNIIKKVYKYFDLDTFEQKSEAVDVPFEPAKDLAEAQTRIGGDESVLLKALNSYLKAQVFAEAEKSVTSKGGRKAVVFAICKPFRALPPWSTMYVLNADGTPKVEDGEKVIDRAAQTASILQVVKSNQAMLDAIRAGSAQASDESDDDNGETE